MRNRPSTMRVIETGAPGVDDGLLLGERPVPEPAAGELLIRVAAAGVNRADIMQRRGNYPPPPGVSDILGLEVSGHVAEVGTDVSGWDVGDPVCALLAGGGYAEYCAVPAPQCLTPPTGVDLLEAAALPEATMTVWTNVFDRGRLTAGETLLVHGGSSGIGTMTIQLASTLGARVFATAGSAAKCAACEELGAERAFNYKETDFAAAAREAAPAGIDVILDMVGQQYLQRNLALLNVEGRLVVIAFMSGFKSEINLATLMTKRLTLTGSTLRARSVEQKGEVVEAVKTHVWPLIEGGRVRPVVCEQFPLEEAVEAHRLMEASTHVGKLLLVCS